MWHFGNLRFDPVRRILYSADSSAHLPPREADLLAALLAAGGKVISKEELLNRVWADCAVEEGNLTQQVSLLRRALHTLDRETSYIETLPKIGYRFLLPARLDHTPASPVRRRGLLLAIALSAAIVAPFFAYQAGVWHRNSQRIPVSSLMVEPVRNLTGNPTNDALCLELQRIICAGLGQATVRVVQLPVPPQALPFPPQGSVLQGALYADDGRLRLHLQAYAPRRPRPIWDQAFYFAQPPTATDLQNLRTILREAFRPD